MIVMHVALRLLEHTSREKGVCKILMTGLLF